LAVQAGTSTLSYFLTIVNASAGQLHTPNPLDSWQYKFSN
jgi:hypothetical protein